MAHEALAGSDWDATVARLGGAATLEAEARSTGAFQRPREVKCGTDLLRLTLAYCLGLVGLRLTAAWADGIGLARLSNVALLGRLRNMVPWLERIVARLLADAQLPAVAAAAAGRRPIRLIDATTVRKAGKEARERGRLWRIHAALDLPHAGESERFSAFELTDETQGERLNRLAVTPGEIRIADAIHCRADDLADVMAAGADVVVRASWRSARWLTPDGLRFDLVAALLADTSGRIDRPVALARDGAEPLAMRLVAFRLPKDKAVEAVAGARAEARSKQRQIQPGTLIAAEWVILVTSLSADDWPAERVQELYRLRWRIEIAFKRLKSVIDLAAPPGACPEVAKAWVLSHLIAVLLTEAHLGALGVSPRSAGGRAPITGAPSGC
jgi:hypothetical protein